MSISKNTVRKLFPRARLASVVAVALLVGGLAACGSGTGGGSTGSGSSSGSGSGSLLAQLKKAGTVRIAIANEPPYTLVRADGTTGGMMVDTLTAAMKLLGVPHLSVTVTTYASMIPGIQAHQFDIVAGGLFLTSERCKQVLFSNPIVVTRSAFAVKRGNPLGITSYHWFLSHKTAKLALITPSSEQEYALNTIHIPASQTIDVPDLQTGVEALLSGRADAVASDELADGGAPNKSQFTSVLTSDGYPQGAGEVFRMQDKALRNAFDQAYKEIISNGTYATIAKRYGIDPTVAPNTTRTQINPACSA